MRLHEALICALAAAAWALDDGHTKQIDKDVAQAESFFPVTSAQDNIIVVNGTRFRIENIEGKPGPDALRGTDPYNFHIRGDTKEYPDRMSLLHPTFWTYWIHTVLQLIAVVMAIYCPHVLLVVLVLAVACWPVSAATGQPIWSMYPGAADWWLMAIKSVIVNICPTVPMMLCLICRPSDRWLQRSAIWTYGILLSNVAWTLAFLAGSFNAVSVTNGICGVSLCLSLIIHNVAVCRRGGGCGCELTLFELDGDRKRRGYGTWQTGDIIYGYGTSLSWLVCYTLWNVLFVCDIAVGLVFQDIAFWAMMAMLYYYSGRQSAIENYFAMARPISLSMYIATSDWPGFHSYFRTADGLGLDVTSHAFFLFLAICNVIYSFYVMFWEVSLLLGIFGADDWFQETFKNQPPFREGDSSDCDSDSAGTELSSARDADTGFFRLRQ